ncbi:MAG: transcription factor [Candidatus Bathyarchaeota archaeon]
MSSSTKTSADKHLLCKVVEKIGGENAVKIVEVLLDKTKATEDELARGTGIKLNEIRKILFKLNSFSLAFSESLQDKKTGWLIFTWRVRLDQLDMVIKNQKSRILAKLKTRFEYEVSHDFYTCNNNGCEKLAFEDAVESIFKCPKCGKSLEHFDNTKVVENLNNVVKSLAKELDSE